MDLQDFLREWNSDAPTVLVHTSGSTGRPRPLSVEKSRMEASARMTCRFLGLREGDSALLCLPLDYIAGKMMVVRALTCGLKLLTVPPTGHPLGDIGPSLSPESPSIGLAAMVPLQVWNTLRVPEEHERLRCVRHLLIGGGPVDDAMAEELRDFPNAVWSTYGMTETLSHIALRRLSGPEASQWYTPFDGVTVSLSEEGCLVVDAPAVHDGPLVTNDIAMVEHPTAPGQSCRRFRILGRKDNVICSGGVKIMMEEVERQLRRHLDVPFMITKAPDARLGEQVVLLTEAADVAAIEALCRQVLPQFYMPRRLLTVAKLPLTETGKPARHEAERLARELV